MPIRRPSPAEMGEVVTIAIVALTAPSGHFVSVSDQMISHDDILPADERGLIKALQISKNWSVAFAANRIENVIPLLDRVRSKIERPANNIEARKVQEYFTASIAEMIRVDFFYRRLARYGYRDLDMFRRQGRDELGDHFFDLCRELDNEELGVECIIYGYETGGYDPQIFEINGKGQIIDRMALRYAVVGSGYWMASASLKRKPLSMDFDPIVYRTLEAKFSAETASGVGRPTTVYFKRPDEHDFMMPYSEIEKIREIWQGKMREPEPEESAEIVRELRTMAFTKGPPAPWVKLIRRTASDV
jgi:hypothetical protein